MVRLDCNEKKIAFFYPSYQLGGAELLYCRVADYLTKLNGWSAFIIDYEGGFLAKYACKNNIEIIVYNDGEKVSAKDIDVLIAPPSFIYRVCRSVELKSECKIIFWSIHPHNIESLLPFFIKIESHPRWYKKLILQNVFWW